VNSVAPDVAVMRSEGDAILAERNREPDSSSTCYTRNHDDLRDPSMMAS